MLAWVTSLARATGEAQSHRLPDSVTVSASHGIVAVTSTVPLAVPVPDTVKVHDSSMMMMTDSGYPGIVDLDSLGHSSSSCHFQLRQCLVRNPGRCYWASRPNAQRP